MLRFSVFLLVYCLANVSGILSIGNEINIAEGNDLYLSLPNPTSMHQTCKLYGPNEEPVDESKVDIFDSYSCGYIVRNVNSTNSGPWTILYGDGDSETVLVNVLAPVNMTLDNLTWDVGSSVDIIVGPENAVYCRVRDNRYHIVFEEFGPCRIVVDRVTLDHVGQWSVNIGVPGTVVINYSSFYVNVGRESVAPVVTTSVARDGQSVVVTCAVPPQYEVSACKFRNPGRTTVIASHGVGQGGYAGGVTSYESDAENHVCTLRIINFASWHGGNWRCAVNTSQGVLYGFLHVTSSADYYQYEPELRSSDEFAYEGEDVTMSCSIDAAIRYCYFRSSNGTVYNVGPSISSPDYEYVGSGFSGGDCGIRFNNILPSQAGQWTCHVGLENDIFAEEKISYFTLSLSERVWAQQFWQYNMITVQMGVAGGYELEYCRFVRNDGLGFTSDNVPIGYRLDRYQMSRGLCVLQAEVPTALDCRPWTVAAKLSGYSGELSRTTNPEYFPHSTSVHSVAGFFLWLFFVILGLMMIFAAISLIPKRNRERTFARAAHIRNSFRRQPPPAQQTAAVQPSHIITELPPKA